MARNRRMEIDIYAKDKTKAGVDSAEKSVSALGPLISAALGAAAIKGAADAFMRQEQAVFQLEQRLKSTGDAAGKTSAELQATARALQQVTVFGDEATLEMQALLLTFTQIKGDQFDEATIAIQNVAAAMGTDLKSAALQVGKALNDPAGQLSALSRSGIQFTKEQKLMIKEMNAVGDVAGAQTIILAELETQFGGAAGAHGLSGAVVQTKNALGDVAEMAGEILAPALTLIANEIQDVADAADSANPILWTFGKTFESLTLGALTLKEMYSGLGQSIGAVSASIAFALEGDFDKAGEVLDTFADDTETRILELAQKIQTIDLLGLGGGAGGAGAAATGGLFRPGAGPQQLAGGGAGGASAIGGASIASGFAFGASFWEQQAEEKFEVISRGLDIELEREAEHYNSLQELAMQDDELNAIRIEERIEAEQRGADILADISRQTVALKQREADGIASITNSLFSTLMTITKGKSKAIFLLQQGVAFGSAIMAAHQASALALANPPGPPATIPMSKIALGMGYANAAAIAATTLTGTGSTSATGGGGTGAAITPVVSQPVSDLPAPESRAITIQIMGNVVDQDKFARELIPSITRAINDGKTLEYA